MEIFNLILHYLFKNNTNAKIFSVEVAMLELAQDDDNREALRYFNMQRRAFRDNSDPFSLPDNVFLKVFRLNKEVMSFW